MPQSIVAAFVCFVLGPCHVSAQALSTTGKPIYVPNEYIVRAQAGSSSALVEQAVTRMGATLVNALPVNDTYLIRMGRGAGTQNVSARSRSAFAQPVRWVIESVQPNYNYYALAIPNDAYWSYQWDMRLINAPGAWEIEKGSTTITVAVIDSGVANHPELLSRIVAGYDFIDNDNDPSNDLKGHGTHVAGTIGAQGNNAFGICGVCWDDVKIMPIRVLDASGGGTSASVIGGEDYALQQGVQVVNLSLGGEVDDPAERTKISEMVAAGIVICAASGNADPGRPGSNVIVYPAGFPEVISVCAVGPQDEIAPYAHFGKVDIAAPGGDSSAGAGATVWSTSVSFDAAGKPTYSYRPMEGTSMACPHVAGAAALLMSHGLVSATEVKSRLMASARPPGTGAMDTVKYGAGILDLQGAFLNARVRIIEPGKGATVGTNPHFQIAIQGVTLDSIRIYVDYADINDNGVPDDPNEGIVMAGATISPDIPTVYSYVNTARTAIEFDWSDLPNADPLLAGAHNIYVSADASSGGGVASDWAVFNVARRKISRGIHLFAFPYALANRAMDTPTKILPGALFGLGASPRSTLQRYLAAPTSSLDITPIGYEVYAPGNPGERVWNNPLTLLGGSLVPTGGGYYYDSLARQQQFAFPAGSGFWLILPTDIWVDETYPTLESLPSFDGSKGFTIPLYRGWNMVGNPYAHQVPWRAALFTFRGQTKTLLDAEFAGWVRSTIYTYGGGGVSTYVGVTDRDLLEPYRGYWVLSLVGGAGQSDSLVLNILP